MAIIQFTAKDLKRGIIVEPGWYKIMIDDVDNGSASKDAKSINYLAEATIIKNDDNGDEAFSGVPVIWNFNSKGIGFMRGLFEALGHTVTTDSRFDTNALAGKTVAVFIGNRVYENKLQNDVQHQYRAPKD